MKRPRPGPPWANEVGIDGGGGGAARQSAKPDPTEEQTPMDSELPPCTTTAAAMETRELRWLRHRQALSGGHPIGLSDEESQPAEWDRLDLRQFRQWVAEGRPSIVVKGAPGQGQWDHP